MTKAKYLHALSLFEYRDLEEFSLISYGVLTAAAHDTDLPFNDYSELVQTRTAMINQKRSEG